MQRNTSNLPAVLFFAGVAATSAFFSYMRSRPHHLSNPELAPVPSQADLLKIFEIPVDVPVDIVQTISSVKLQLASNTPSQFDMELKGLCKNSALLYINGCLVNRSESSSSHLERVDIIRDEKLQECHVSITATLLTSLADFKTFSQSSNMPSIYNKIVAKPALHPYIRSVQPMGETKFIFKDYHEVICKIKAVLEKNNFTGIDVDITRGGLILRIPSITKFNSLTSAAVRSALESEESKSAPLPKLT